MFVYCTVLPHLYPLAIGSENQQADKAAYFAVYGLTFRSLPMAGLTFRSFFVAGLTFRVWWPISKIFAVAGKFLRILTFVINVHY